MSLGSRRKQIEPSRVSRRLFCLFPTLINRARSRIYRLAGCRSNSAGGTPPSEVCSRSLLNQATYSTIASSSCERLRQTRSRISSVLKLSTKLSAAALVEGVADGADRGEHAVVVEGLAVIERRVLTAGVAVMDERDGAGSAEGERHPQRIEDEV